MKLNQKDLSDKELLENLPSPEQIKDYVFENEKEHERVGINLVYGLKKWLTNVELSCHTFRHATWTKLVKWAIRSYTQYLYRLWKVEELNNIKKEYESNKQSTTTSSRIST